ncbi:MAG: ferritin family protein [Planctomycetota bacterium]
MSDFDSYRDILEFAIAREQDAFEFYNALAQRSTNSAISFFFDGLAKQEVEHKETLELELMKSGSVVLNAGKPSAQNISTEEYISRFFVDPGGGLDMAIEDVLMLAIRKEKASFRLYVDLAAMVDSPQSRETLLLLAEEEARHKTIFEIEYEKTISGEV